MFAFRLVDTIRRKTIVCSIVFYRVLSSSYRFDTAKVLWKALWSFSSSLTSLSFFSHFPLREIVNRLIFNEHTADELEDTQSSHGSWSIPDAWWTICAGVNKHIWWSFTCFNGMYVMQKYKWDDRRVNGVQDCPVSLSLPVIHLALQLVDRCFIHSIIHSNFCHCYNEMRLER